MSGSSVLDSVLSSETYRVIRAILQREGIDPELQAQTEVILCHWLRSAKRETHQLQTARLMEGGAKLAAKYRYLIEFKPWRSAEIANVEALLDALKAEVHQRAVVGRTA